MGKVHFKVQLNEYIQLVDYFPQLLFYKDGAIMNDNEQIIIEFINAWSRLDVTELTSYFADDGIYHNIPLSPVTGKKEIENFIKSFTANWTVTNWDILNIISKDSIVMVERLDRTKMEGEKSVNLPCIGVFEMENGKIKIWRDYFDLGMYLKALE